MQHVSIHAGFFFCRHGLAVSVSRLKMHVQNFDTMSNQGRMEASHRLQVTEARIQASQRRQLQDEGASQKDACTTVMSAMVEQGAALKVS